MRIAPDLAAETRRILALAWPVILTGLNWTILHVTDIVMVGYSGTGEVAALGASRAITFPGIVMGIGALTGVLVYSARADGAGDLRATGRILHQGLLFAILLGLVSGAILFGFAYPMLRGMGVAEGIAPAAADVVRVMALAYPAQLIIIAASYFLEGVSRPRRVAVVNLSILPLNALLAWAWSGGHLGFPAMGAVGAASATAVASAIGAIGMVAAAWTLPRARERGVRDLSDFARRDSWSGVGRLAMFGAVPAIASGLELAGFAVLIALSTQLGETATHAFQIVFSIHNVTFAVAIGMGSAAGVRVGNAVGEGVPQDAGRRAAIAATLSGLITGALAIVLILIPLPFVAAFPGTERVHLLALAMLPVWAPFILFDGVQVVFVSALRSLGDQLVAGINSVTAFFVVTGGMGMLLVHAGWGPMGLVFASGTGMMIAALLNGTRLHRINRRFRSRS